MILAKHTKAIISLVGISLALLALTAGASLAEDETQTSSSCPCCKEMMKEGSH